MQMHNPPHPGEFIEGVYLEPCALSIRQVAERLGVSASTFQRLVAGKSRVSPDMALRLSRVLGRSAESMACHAGQPRPLAGPSASRCFRADPDGAHAGIKVLRDLEVFDGLQLLNWFEEP